MSTLQTVCARPVALDPGPEGALSWGPGTPGRDAARDAAPAARLSAVLSTTRMLPARAAPSVKPPPAVTDTAGAHESCCELEPLPPR